MSAAHTPGPWEAWLGKSTKFGVTGPAAAAAMQAVRAMDEGFGKGLWVELASASKVCPGLALGDSPEEARANARLIAAAPDLLEALILMVRTHDEPAESSLQMAKEQQWLEKARAVIAKATGSAS